MPHCQSYLQTLRKRGYRITPQREMIIEALAHSDHHVTAEQLYTQVHDRSRAVNLASVYRTLDLLVLDEPTAGLDPRSRRSLIRLLAELPLTMLASTHDMLLVGELFPRMVILDEGQIVADGTTAALMQDAALLEAYGLEKPCF